MNRFRILSCLAVLLFSALSAAPAVAGSRTLRVVTIPGKGVGVAGTGWGQGRVVVSLQTGPWVLAVSVQPNARGRFSIAAIGANLCARVLFRAFDAHRHGKSAKGPPLGCASPADYPRPHLVVVSGRRVAPPSVRVVGTHPASVTLHVGDVLYLWEPGTTTAFFSPQLADSLGILQLIAQGQTPAKTCAEADCAAGFYWKWLAVGTGETSITLSAACREAKPPCMVPDFLIRIHILP
jgi:hypothetical protein